jgi:hypothetical protein
MGRAPLRAVAPAVLAATLCAASAEAQTWREYRYPGFAIQFPVEPTVENGIYAADEGTSVHARRYSVRDSGALYRVTVADFSGTPMSEAQALSEAVAQLAANGEVIVDVPHRVNRVLGRQLSIVRPDGSRSAIALFYRFRQLYLIEGTIFPAHDDPMSAEGVRFQQSLRFILNNARGDFLCEIRRVPRNLVDGTR